MRTTSKTNQKSRILVAAWAAIWCCELCIGSAAPIWAQNRQAEPEANPQFQQDLQGGAQQGGPIGASAPPSAAEPGTETAPGVAADTGTAFPTDSPNVQIGAVPAERPAPATPTNPLDTRIVVRVKNAPLATFLDTISAQARVNFIITEGLEEKRITAFLQNVTVREALQVLLEMKGLTYQRIGRSNTYVVAPRAKGVPNRITRIYQLNFIPLIEIQGIRDFNQQSQQDQGQSFPISGGASGGAAPSGIPIIVVLRSVLSRLGTLALDARTNSIIVTDIPEVFPQVEQILAELDKKAPQVLIEAQIVEIDSDRAQQLGLEWGGTNGELATFIGPMRDTSFPLNLPRNMDNFHFFDPLTGVTSILQGGSGGTGSTTAPSLRAVSGTVPNQLQLGILDLSQLRVVLRALVTRAEARFLGKPKVLTLNNKSARIEITQKQAVALRTLTTQGGGTNQPFQQSIEPSREDTGLFLDVTPQVNREGYISLLIVPEFTDVVESKVSSRANPVFDPIRRKANTLVRVRNGQTLVLGGLLQSRETKAVRKVPILGYIPILGWLFTSVNSLRSNTDLVIFLTPTIIND